jgi:hypothetical protein
MLRRSTKQPFALETDMSGCPSLWEFTRIDSLGIQRSGPSFLEMSCDGISASRNATLKMVLP